MAARKRFSASEVRDLLADSSDDSSVIDSESDAESNFSDFEASDSDESSGTVSYDATAEFSWCDQPRGQPVRLPFSGSPGRKAAIEDVSDVLQFFRLFLTIQMLEAIVGETNRRAEQLLQNTQKPQARIRKWTDIDQDELLVFMSLIIYQGIIRKPEVEMYWTVKPLLETPYIRSIMSEKRYGMILKCLHFVDNSTLPTTFPHPGERSFAKIKPFFQSVVHQFSTVYVPNQDIAIDESLMLWKGRLAMKQYIPLKRARFGLVVRTL